MAKLVCIEGANQGDEFNLLDQVTTIGRSNECDITIFDKKCSREHCRLYNYAGSFTVEDAGSRNGTFVNGRRIVDFTPMKSGDKIKIGKSIFIISNKAMGDKLAETTSEVMDDLEKRGFSELVKKTAAAQGGAPTQAELEKMFGDTPQKKGFFRRLFGS